MGCKASHSREEKSTPVSAARKPIPVIAPVKRRSIPENLTPLHETFIHDVAERIVSSSVGPDGPITDEAAHQLLVLRTFEAACEAEPGWSDELRSQAMIASTDAVERCLKSHRLGSRDLATTPAELAAARRRARRSSDHSDDAAPIREIDSTVQEPKIRIRRRVSGQ